MKRILLAFLALTLLCALAQINFLLPANMAHGSSLPSTCNVGDFFQLTTAAVSAQIYACTATNTWTAQGEGPGAVEPRIIWPDGQAAAYWEPA